MLIIIFFIGLSIGSFLNVCIYRIPAGKSIVYPPSSCGNCGTRLNAIDMIPVVNYIVNKGKCRYCGEKYSLQYPLVELLNGVLYLTIMLKYRISLFTVYYCVIVSMLIVISFIDYKHKIIPDRLVVFGFIISIMFNVFNNNLFQDKLIGMVIGFGIFTLIAVITNAMGGGDIKLMALLGFIFGMKGILFITIMSFVLGAIISVILLAMKIKSRKDEIAFGPFISLATILYILFGQAIIYNYMNLVNLI